MRDESKKETSMKLTILALVTTIIGGGSTRASGTLGTNFQMVAWVNLNLVMPTVIPLPNGDIYFYDDLAQISAKKNLEISSE